MTDDDRPPPSVGYRRARPDEIGLFGINSQDRPIGDKSQSLLDTKAGRIVFYGGMTYSIGSLIYITGSLAVESIKTMMHKGMKR